MIHSWSHSRATDFEACKHRAYLKYVQKIPEPERTLKPGQTEHANDRGSRIHNECELAVREKGKLPREAHRFVHEFEALTKLYQAKKVSLEGEWGFDLNWDITDWQSAWLRMKLDALVLLTQTEAVAIDYKTGRLDGNQIKHGEQVMLYQLATFLRFPELEIVHTELWYLDQDMLTRRTFTREQGLTFKRNWNRRGIAITTCTDFPANPNKWSCQYCAYGDPHNGFPNGTGDCQQGRR